MSGTRKFLLLCGDVALLYGALALTLLFRYPLPAFQQRWHDHLLPFSALFAVWILIFWLLDFYQQRVFVNYNSLAERLMAALGVSVLSSVVMFYLFQGFFRLTPKTNLVIFAVIVAAAEYIYRSAYLAIAKFRPEPAIVIGNSAEIRELLAYLKSHPHSGYQAAAWMENPDAAHLAELPELMRKHGAHSLIVQPAMTKDQAAIRAFYGLLPLGVNIMSFPDFYELVFERVPLDELEEGWFIEHITTRRPVYDQAKRVIDLILSAIIFVVLLPLTALVALLVKLTSAGPAIYKQKRYGKNDRIFTLYKFRTMRANAGGAFWTEKNDDRITGFGKFLRFTHLDEIPQLWNIIRGDISFTGPRPERLELADQYRQFPYYNIRHVVKPGLTGWAQINYKPSASLEEGKEKLKYDIYYVKNRSFFLDLAIFLKTIKYIFITAE